MRQQVEPGARRRDLIALVILAAGAAIAVYGYLGLHTMASKPIVREAGHQAIARAISYNNVVIAGWVVMAVGIVAVVWSFVAYRRSPHAPR